MNYKFDIKRITDGNVHIEGWILPKNPYSEVTFNVFDGNNEIPILDLTRTKRHDVAEIYLKDYDGSENFGFSFNFPFDDLINKTYKLVITTEGKKITTDINKKAIDSFNSFDYKKKELFLSYFNSNTFKRAFDFLLKEGPISFVKKTNRKLKGIHVDYDYNEWYKLTKTNKDELERQRSDDSFCYKPFYSIVIPIYNTDEQFLKLLFDSILNQTYQNFEVCVADATDYSKSNNNPKKFFEKLNSDKVKVKYLEKNLSIADNTNACIKMAKGDYIILCDHDDELTLDALYEVTKAINENPNAELIYSDEDKVDTKGEDFFEPAFKPDFNLDMLLSVNYFCHLTTIKKTLLDKLYDRDKTYERAEYNGAQDYDLFLRLITLTNNIFHIKKVLYHWRCHKKSTSKNVSSKDYAFQNGAKAIENYYKITSVDFPLIDHVEKGFDFGIYHTIYKMEEDLPLISVVIPNKDHANDLKIAIESLKDGVYKNLEFIICENNSTENATFDYYNVLKNDKSLNCKIVTYEGTFNYSKINNFAVKNATGEYILFLNNDIEMINKNSLFEMFSYIRRSDVGAVGAKLLYKDKTIQHAGVILGLGGAAGHAFVSLNDFDHSYMNRAHIVQDMSAVTAACLLTKKSIFDEIGGFDENIAVAFNDIDLCIKIREKNKLIVYNPYASFYHYESKSRGYENTKEKVDRFNKETAYLIKKWSHILTKIDMYYNPNLTLRKADFSLRNLKFEKIGEPFVLPNEIIDLMKNI